MHFKLFSYNLIELALNIWTIIDNIGIKLTEIFILWSRRCLLQKLSEQPSASKNIRHASHCYKRKIKNLLYLTLCAMYIKNFKSLEFIRFRDIFCTAKNSIIFSFFIIKNLNFI